MTGKTPPVSAGPHAGGENGPKLPPPSSVREVPSYLLKLCTGFFSRLFYIFGLVWSAKPWILWIMVLMAVYNGVAPVFSAFIGAQLLNALAEAATAL